MERFECYKNLNVILNEAHARVGRYSESKIKHLKEILEHGLGELKTEEEMDMYLASYGEIHQAKLLLAYSNLPRKILAEEKLSVIDYGCGQGIASIVLCDVLQCNGCHREMISDFCVIEPSRACLKRAVDYIHNSCPYAQIEYYNNPCEDVWALEFNPNSEVVIHLLSNVVDMPDFPREVVADKINRMNDHNNIVVCVSPFYQENGRAKHMDEFGDKLHAFSCIHSFERHKDDWEKPYSCQIRVYTNKWY